MLHRHCILQKHARFTYVCTIYDRNENLNPEFRKQSINAPLQGENSQLPLMVKRYRRAVVERN